MQEQSRREELLAHMSELAPKERLVLTLRHGVSDNVPKRLGEIAEFLNRERENVTAILDAAEEKVCTTLSMSRSELAQLLLYTNPNERAARTFWSLGDIAEGMTPQIDFARVGQLEGLKQHGAVQKTIDALSLEEKTILKLRYGVLQDDELTLRDIGEILGLSRERVRQIESRAEQKCRRSVRRR
jgi:RNA polymerase primary sigma factor